MQPLAPIVQRIEQARPKGKMCVQFMLGAQFARFHLSNSSWQMKLCEPKQSRQGILGFAKEEFWNKAELEDGYLLFWAIFL